MECIYLYLVYIVACFLSSINWCFLRICSVHIYSSIVLKVNQRMTNPCNSHLATTDPPPKKIQATTPSKCHRKSTIHTRPLSTQHHHHLHSQAPKIRGKSQRSLAKWSRRTVAHLESQLSAQTRSLGQVSPSFSPLIAT